MTYPFAQKARLTLGFNVMYGSIRHAGYDFGTADFSHDTNKNNDWIRAMDKGLCIGSALAKDGTGEYVIMYYPNQDVSFNYWHLGRRVAVIGKWYKEGDIIAYVGHSGKWAEHTHIGVKKGKRLGSLWDANILDPQPFFNKMKLWNNLAEDPVVILELTKEVEFLKKSIAQYQSDLIKREDALREATAEIKASVAEIALKANRITELEQLLLHEQNKPDTGLQQIEQLQILLDAEKRANGDLQHERENLFAANTALNTKISSILDEIKKQSQVIEEQAAWRLLHENTSLPLSYYLGMLIRRIIKK
jgi:hypothetical protein